MYQNGTAPPPLAAAVITRDAQRVTTYTLTHAQVTIEGAPQLGQPAYRATPDLPQFICTGTLITIASDPATPPLTHWQRVRLALGALWREVIA
jgi:hypothetical protein